MVTSLHRTAKKPVSIYPIALPRGYRYAFGVRGRQVEGKCYTTYAEVRVKVSKVWFGRKTVSVLEFQCSCVGNRKYGKLCYHIKGVIRQVMPSVSIWRSKKDAQRQRRKRYRVLSRSRMYWLTDRTHERRPI
jgi:hypothetical protein